MKYYSIKKYYFKIFEKASETDEVCMIHNEIISVKTLMHYAGKSCMKETDAGVNEEILFF